MRERKLFVFRITTERKTNEVTLKAKSEALDAATRGVL